MKKAFMLFISILLLASCFVSCAPTEKEFDFGLDLSESVALTIWGSLTDFPALEPIIQEFETKYPNCTVIYRLLDDYDKNLLTKLETETQTANMFLGYRETFRTTPELAQFALDYADYETVGVDMSELNAVLTDSAICDDGGQYVIPLGLESRGLAVNTSLLSAHGLEVPKNYGEFTAACDKLVEAGLVPIQTYHDECVMQLMYPYVANTIVHGENYESVFASMNAREAGTSQYLSSAFTMLDGFTKRGYLSYEENAMVTAAHYGVEGSYQAAVMNFLEGDVAFSPMTASCFCSIAVRETLSEEFSANPFTYEFIPVPLAEDGCFGYLQPWAGICINKQSDHTNWSRAFVNFLCAPKRMIAIAEGKGIIPNIAKTADDHRFDSVLSLDDKHITNLSMFTNDFYSPLRNTLQRLGHPFEYAGQKGDFAPDAAQTYYTKESSTYVTVADFDAVPDGEPLYVDCTKKRAIAAVGDEEFAPLADTVYYTLGDGAYTPVTDAAALAKGTRLYVDDFTQAGEVGSEKFVPDAAKKYYLLTDSGFVPIADISQAPTGEKVFTESEKVPYRMNEKTAPAYYESQIGH